MADLERMVADCIKHECMLAPDEMQFIDAMERTLRAGQALTYAQAERLRELWNKTPW